ncbi:hypothetical protein ACYT7O_10930, partial [Streptococcus pyogenes]
SVMPVDQLDVNDAVVVNNHHVDEQDNVVDESMVTPNDVDDDDVNAEWRMSDEGRCGTPGAAGLEYQKYAEQQQHGANEAV